MITLARPPGRLLGLLLATAIGTACGTAVSVPSPASSTLLSPSSSMAMPVPTCGGLKIGIDSSLPCGRIAEIAVATLRERAPQQLARGVTAIDVVLAECPRGEVPPQITCGDSQFAQLVTVTFGPAGGSGLIEPSLTVAIEPVTGAVLGIANPLIR